MTVIVWDGTTLAADKQGTSANLARTVTKIHRIPNGILGFCGVLSHGMAVLEWFRNGEDKDKWPYPKGDDVASTAVLVIRADGACMYHTDEGPHPERFEDPFIAIGSGRDYAMAAMYLGCDARHAVEVACKFDVTCGQGIDTLELLKSEPTSCTTPTGDPNT